MSFAPMYLQQGAKFERRSEIDDLNGNVDFKLAYLELPIYLKITFENRTFRPYLMAGPAIGLKLSSYADVISSFGFNGKRELDDQTEGINFGVGFGSGFSFNVGRKVMFLQILYVNGFPDVLYTELTDGRGAELKTRSIQFMTGFTLPFGT